MSKIRCLWTAVVKKAKCRTEQDTAISNNADTRRRDINYNADNREAGSCQKKSGSKVCGPMSWSEGWLRGVVLMEGFSGRVSQKGCSEAVWRGLTEVFGLTGGLCVC